MASVFFFFYFMAQNENKGCHLWRESVDEWDVYVSEDVERIEMFSLLNPQGFGDTFKSTDNTVRAL